MLTLSSTPNSFFWLASPDFALVINMVILVFYVVYLLKECMLWSYDAHIFVPWDTGAVCKNY